MIARIWHGKTSIENMESYTQLLEKLAIPDYKKTKGFKGLSFLQNINNGEAHWESIEMIKNFAVNDYEKQNITRKTMITY